MSFSPPTLKLARQALGLTQAALARACDIPAASLASYEQGTRAPSPARLLRLAVALGISPEMLNSGDTLAPAPSAALASVRERLTALAPPMSAAEFERLAREYDAPSETERQERLDARARLFLSGQTDLIEPELRAILAVEDEAALRARAERHAARLAPPPIAL